MNSVQSNFSNIVSNTSESTPENLSINCLEIFAAKPWLNFFFSTVYFSIFFIGGIGNGVVIWILTKKNKNGMANYRRSVTNLFVLNLATADLTFVGFLPIWASVYFV